MAQLKAKPPRTVEDYLRLPEGTRAELIEGQILMLPSPRVRHQRIVGRIYRLLDEFVRRHRLGEVFVSPFDVHLPTADIVQPDVIYVPDEKNGIVEDWIRGTPDLLIEVLSPESPERDRIVKRDVYARARVPEYWIVDPDLRAIEVLALAGRKYEPFGYFRAPGEVSSKVLPRFAASLDEIFA